MRFIHIADVHLGAEPEAGTAYSKRRPDELWETFSEVVSLCEQEQTDLLLIAGDLFHRQPLLRELKEVDYLFSKLTPATRRRPCSAASLKATVCTISTTWWRSTT